MGALRTGTRLGAGGAALIAAHPIGSDPASKTTSFDFIVQCSCQTAYTRKPNDMSVVSKRICILLQKITVYPLFHQDNKFMVGRSSGRLVVQKLVSEE
jgi:hypothetical protein